MASLAGKIERERDLQPIEVAALHCCTRAAAEGRQLTQYDICEAVGSLNRNGGTAAGVLNRLEEKGYITRTSYQRGLQVCITSTGQCTAPPRDTSPHWRSRPERVPAPSLHLVRERARSLSQRIEDRARHLGRPIGDFLMDCVYAGFLVIEREEQGG